MICAGTQMAHSALQLSQIESRHLCQAYRKGCGWRSTRLLHVKKVGK